MEHRARRGGLLDLQVRCPPTYSCYLPRTPSADHGDPAQAVRPEHAVQPGPERPRERDARDARRGLDQVEPGEVPDVAFRGM